MTISGARYPLILQTEKGEVTYQMSELSDIDLDEMDNWVRARYMNTARQMIAGAHEKDRAEVITLALSIAASMTAVMGTGLEIASTPFGLAHMLFIAVNKSHPDADERAFRRWLTNPDNISRYNEAFRALNLPEFAGKKGGL